MSCHSEKKKKKVTLTPDPATEPEKTHKYWKLARCLILHHFSLDYAGVTHCIAETDKAIIALAYSGPASTVTRPVCVGRIRLPRGLSAPAHATLVSKSSS